MRTRPSEYLWGPYNGISYGNLLRAENILVDFFGLDRTLKCGNRLWRDAYNRINVYRQSQITPLVHREWEAMNSDFGGDMSLMRREAGAIRTDGNPPVISPEAYMAHELAAALVPEAVQVNRRGAPESILIAASSLASLGFYDEIVRRALEHMVLDEYGEPRLRAIRVMGEMGNEEFLPTLRKAYHIGFRNWRRGTEEQEEQEDRVSFDATIEALKLMGRKTPEALDFLEKPTGIPLRWMTRHPDL